jgi:hypothetical protein
LDQLGDGQVRQGPGHAPVLRPGHLALHPLYPIAAEPDVARTRITPGTEKDVHHKWNVNRR